MKLMHLNIKGDPTMKFPVYSTLLLSACLFNILCWLECALTGEPMLPRSDAVMLNAWAETLLLCFSIVGGVGSAVHIAMYIVEKHAECMLHSGKELVREADLWLDRASLLLDIVAELTRRSHHV